MNTFIVINIYSFMEYCNEDFTILSLIPIEIMNNKTMIKLIKIGLNHYNNDCLESDTSYIISKNT